MKADAYSPTMTSSVCARTQAIKEKCATCVSAYRLSYRYNTISFEVDCLGPCLIFPNNENVIILFLKQRLTKSRARCTDSAASIGLETTPLILISADL